MSRREATKEANRAALLAAAREVFTEHGYEGAGVREVVRRTDLAPGTFYNYFDGKDGVFRALLEEIGAEARDRVRSARLAAKTPEGFVTEGFRAFFAFIAAEPETFAFLERNADAVLPAALDELREDLAGAARTRRRPRLHRPRDGRRRACRSGARCSPAARSRLTRQRPLQPVCSPEASLACLGDAFPFHTPGRLRACAHAALHRLGRVHGRDLRERSRRCSMTRTSRGSASSRRA